MNRGCYSHLLSSFWNSIVLTNETNLPRFQTFFLRLWKKIFNEFMLIAYIELIFGHRHSDKLGFNVSKESQNKTKHTSIFIMGHFFRQLWHFQRNFQTSYCLGYRQAHRDHSIWLMIRLDYRMFILKCNRFCYHRIMSNCNTSISNSMVDSTKW